MKTEQKMWLGNSKAIISPTDVFPTFISILFISAASISTSISFPATTTCPIKTTTHFVMATTCPFATTIFSSLMVLLIWVPSSFFLVPLDSFTDGGVLDWVLSVVYIRTLVPISHTYGSLSSLCILLSLYPLCFFSALCLSSPSNITVLWYFHFRDGKSLGFWNESKPAIDE